ncbi:MAG: zf-TFIIB domain-containing protein [Roseovarius sp.]|nr:zf-TFIIB domain-containing protein [Roseovarius sp.]
MICPNDGTPLVMTGRSGVEIDYCPSCRGVWLDRGELEKIIERSILAAPVAPPDPDCDTTDAEQRKRKRGGFLEELFDF